MRGFTLNSISNIVYEAVMEGFLPVRARREKQVMRVSVLMSREPTYTRNKVILRGLKEAGLDVVEYCDHSSKYPARFVKVLGRYAASRSRKSDAVLVGFFGQPLMPFVRRMTDLPIVLDIFLSGFDTMCFDRGRFGPRSLPGRFFFWLDRTACEKADVVLLDTNEHIEYFASTFGVPRDKFRRIFVGADTNLFHPRPENPGAREDRPFTLFYYCTYHPVHGTEHIIRAAHLLREHADIRFHLVGMGQERARIEQLSRQLGVANVEFTPWVEYEKLPEAIARCDVCLGGHFSTVDKASRVIAGKVYQFLAMKKPTIVGDNPANRELLTSGEDSLMVPMGDSDALAGAILELRNDEELRRRIASGGYETFENKCTPAIIGGEISRVLQEVISAR